MSDPKYTYWVEFIDYEGVQRYMYLRGESVQQIKAIMDGYEVVVIDNTEVAEQPYWGSQAKKIEVSYNLNVQASRSIREQIKSLYSIPDKTPDQDARLVELYRRYYQLEDQYADA